MSKLRKYLLIAICSLLALAILGIATVNYDSLLYLLWGLLVGVILAVICYFLTRALVKAWKKGIIRGVLFTFVAFILVSMAASVFHSEMLVFWSGPCARPGIGCAPERHIIESHVITVYPVDLAEGDFTVEERLELAKDNFTVEERTVYKQIVQSPKRIVKAQRAGFLLNKLVIPGPGGREVKFKGRDGTLTSLPICGDYCTGISVELINISKNVFHSSDTNEQPSIPNHPDPVDINWKIPSFYSGRRKDVVFWYYPPEISAFRTLLSPFVGVSTLSGFFVGVLGLVVSLVVTPLLLPVLQEIIKNWIKEKVKAKDA